MIFLKFRKIADNLPRSGEDIVRTLIAAMGAAFWHHFSPPPRGHVLPESWPILIRD